MNINGRAIGTGEPVFVIAEISCNHNGSLELAKRLILAAQEAGADAVKLQCLEPWEVTVDSDHPAYRLTEGPWAGRRLWDLYTEAQTPHAWMPELFAYAREIGTTCFASVFSPEGVKVLEACECPAYKIASAEVTCASLVWAAAATRRPILLSDGMATQEQLKYAHSIIRTAHASEPGEEHDAITLRCASEYPAPPESYGLGSFAHWPQWMNGRWGISDHTTGSEAAIAAVALGACVIEKHLMLEAGAYCTAKPDPITLPEYFNSITLRKPLDHGHSLTPRQFKAFVDSIRTTERMLSSTERTITGGQWRRRLVYARDLSAGHVVSPADLRVVRCGWGSEPDDIVSVCVELVDEVKTGEPAWFAERQVVA